MTDIAIYHNPPTRVVRIDRIARKGAFAKKDGAAVLETAGNPRR